MISSQFKVLPDNEYPCTFESSNILDPDLYHFQNELCIAIKSQNLFLVLDIIKAFKKHLEECKSIPMLPEEFLFDLISLFSNSQLDVIQECSFLIHSLIIKNNQIGIFLIENHFIDLLSQIMESNQEIVITLFPLIRSLLSLGIQFDIPIHLIEKCIECPDLQIEFGIFLDNLSSFQQEQSIQNFIFISIRKMVDMNYHESYQYLADSLYNLSNHPHFAIDLFLQNHLNEFIIILLKNKEFGCVMLICMFLTNMVKIEVFDLFSEEVLKEIIKYSISFRHPKRCVSAIKLLNQLLDSSFSQSELFDICAINKRFLTTFCKMKDSLPCQIKKEISIFVINSLLTIELDSESLLQFVAFGVFDLINYVLFLSDEDFVKKSQQVILNYAQHFHGLLWEKYIINNLQTSIEFDVLSSINTDEDESMDQFLLTLSSIIDQDQE